MNEYVDSEYIEPHVRTIIQMAKHGHLTEENLRPYLELIYKHGFYEGHDCACWDCRNRDFDS